MDLTRSKSELVLGNALLRQQLIVLQRQTKRPALTWRDRTVMVLASKLHSWKEALMIVQPDTLLRWHRELFRRTLRRKSKPQGKQGRKLLTDDVVALIKRMAKENLSWGAERIRGELLKLEIKVSKSTIQKYMNQVREAGSSKQTRSTFLRNHAQEIWACDFLLHNVSDSPLLVDGRATPFQHLLPIGPMGWSVPHASCWLPVVNPSRLSVAPTALPPSE